MGMNQQRHTLGAQKLPGDDVNWSQVSETLSMLALAVAQIDTSLQEGSQSVNQLTSNFTAMADNAQKLLTIASESGDSIPVEIGTIARELQNEIHHAIIAFQFYDTKAISIQHMEVSDQYTNQCKYQYKLTTPPTSTNDKHPD